MDRVQLQAAYILHHRPLRETSVIADLLTPDHGRVSVVARGARSPKSKTRVLLQPFRPLLVSWVGRGELKTLSGIEEQGLAFALSGLSMGCAYYVNELMLRLAPPFTPLHEAFALYSRTLAVLPGNETPEPLLRQFELELLDSLGLLPDYGHCVNGFEAPLPGNDYLYHPATGFALNWPPPEEQQAATESGTDVQPRRVAESSPTASVHERADSSGYDSEHAEFSQVTPESSVRVSGEVLLALAAGMHGVNTDDKALWKQAKRVMRRQIRVHIGDAPLRSREMLAQVVPGGVANARNI